jgi:hypothetical protein
MAAGAALLLTLAACRQADGAMPVPAGEQPNKVEDISRDLQNLTSGDANAPIELSDDLSSLDPLQRPAASITAISKDLGAALGGKTLSDADAKRIATLLFVALSARELSDAQIEQVGADLQTTLVAVGAETQAAARVSTAAKSLASEITRNQKRWYHR